MLRAPTRLLWGLAALSVVANLATGLFPDSGPPVAVASVVTLPLLAFAFAHACVVCGLRNAAVFAIICMVVSNVFENVSILTGFPFGHYRYSDALGPKLFLVPALIGPAYVAMGYLSWLLARLILGATNAAARHALLTVPLAASLFLVCWNLAFEPGASTLRGFWIWQDGGSFFGVPLTNSLGWFLTAYTFFQLYELYLYAISAAHNVRCNFAKVYCLQAVLVYASVTVMMILLAFTVVAPESVTDQAGVLRRAREIYAACALLSLFTMGAFTTLALVRIAKMAPRSSLPAREENRMEALSS
jgi:putative membrane protein